MDATKIITKHLDSVASHLRRGAVWDDWLDIVEATLRMLPVHVAAVAEAMTRGEEPMLAEDDDEAKEVWAGLQRAGYSPSDFTHFAAAYAALMDAVVEPDGSPVYRDVLAVVHESWAGANERNGQYLTPWDLCVVMAKCTMDGAETMLRERIMAALDDETRELLESLGLDATQSHTLEHIAKRFLSACIDRFEPISVCDPCCGSGTFFLACAQTCPQWAVGLGLIRFYGQDIDRTAVQMSRINLMSRGLNGYGLKLRVAASPLARLFAPTAAEAETIAAPPLVPDFVVEAGVTDLFGEPARRVA
jgi:ribosomal protein L11 methylase PrmA